MTTLVDMIEFLKGHKEGQALLKKQPSLETSNGVMSELDFYVAVSVWIAQVIKLYHKLQHEIKMTVTEKVQKSRNVTAEDDARLKAKKDGSKP